MGLRQGEAGAPPPTEAGQGLGGLPSRNCLEVVAVAAAEDGEEGAGRSRLPPEEGVVHNSRVADCSNQDVGAGTPMEVVVDGDAGTGKDQVGPQEGAVEALRRSNRAAAGKCREAGTGPDTGLPPGVSDGDHDREAAAAVGVEEEECRGW